MVVCCLLFVVCRLLFGVLCWCFAFGVCSLLFVLRCVVLLVVRCLMIVDGRVGFLVFQGLLFVVCCVLCCCLLVGVRCLYVVVCGLLIVA